MATFTFTRTTLSRTCSAPAVTVTVNEDATVKVERVDWSGNVLMVAETHVAGERFKLGSLKAAAAFKRVVKAQGFTVEGVK